MVDSLDIWNDCVATAKNKFKKNSCGYQIIKGNVLRDAQRAYCAIMLSK